MKKYKFELTATIDLIVEGEDKEEARRKATDMRLFDSIEYNELYVSDGEEIE